MRKFVTALIFVLIASVAIYSPSVWADSGGTTAGSLASTDPDSADRDKTEVIFEDGDQESGKNGNSTKSEYDPRRGLDIASDRGNLRLSLPVDLHDDDLEITITPRTTSRGTGTRTLSMWNLTAEAKSDGGRVTQFRRPLLLEFSYTEEDMVGLDVDTLRIVYLDESTNTWVALPSSIDIRDRTVTAETDHFSIYGTQAESAYALPGQVMNFQADLHSGASTYTIPIEYPSAPSGWQPLKLNLTYNSASVDEMKNKRDVASWVGIGWSLDLPHISYNEEKDTHYLSMNGLSAELVESSTDDEWFTRPNLNLKIESFVHEGYAGFNVYDRDGNWIQFGGEAPIVRHRFADSCDTTNIDYRFDLESITGPNGNRLIIEWTQTDETKSGCSAQTRDSVPDYLTIRYATNAYEYIVDFNSSDGRTDIPGPTDPDIVSLSMLDSIDVEEKTPSTTNNIRTYGFNYTTTAAALGETESITEYAGTHELDSVTRTGLPTETFDYENRDIKFEDDAWDDSERQGDWGPTQLTGNVDFGLPVVIDGDTMAVGAAYPGNSAGSVYIYVRSYGGWTLQQKITPSDPSTNQRFGRTIGLDGDTILVGAFYDDSTATDSGAVYAFTRSGTTWTQQQKIKADTVIGGDIFGGGLALDGDNAIIGAPRNDAIDTNAGAVYWYEHNGTSWIYKSKFSPSNIQASDEFGDMIALEGTTLVLGARMGDAETSGAGSVYVYELSGGSWSEDEEFGDPGTSAGDQFGTSVAIDNDIIVVGSKTSAFVYKHDGTDWEEIDELPQESDGLSYTYYAHTVAIDQKTIVVGAIYGTTSSGRVYAFRQVADEDWDYEETLTADTITNNASFGGGLDVGDDRVVAGSPGCPCGTSNAPIGWLDTFKIYGAAYPGNPGNPATITHPYLDTIENGYGAKITFDYAQSPTTLVPQYWTRNVVTKTTADPDPATETDGVPIVTDYVYLDAGGSATAPAYEPDGPTDWTAEYRGFPLVRVISADDSYSEHRFYTVGDVGTDIVTVGHPNVNDTEVDRDGERLRGKKYESIRYSSTDKKMSLDFWDWQVDVIDETDDSYSTLIDNQVSQTFNSAGTDPDLTRWTQTEWDSYGNATEVRVDDDFNSANASAESITYYGYTANTTDWIVNRKHFERVYEGFASDTDTDARLSETRYFYDSAAYATAPTDGNLTKVRSYEDANNYVDTTFAYDTYGNVTSTTDPNSETTSYTYDSNHHKYRTEVEYPQIGATAAQEATTTWDTTLGVPLTKTDVNGNTTTYNYDSIGRVTSIIEPGDSEAQPTTTFAYNDWGTAGDQHIRREQKSSTDTYSITEEYFDGFGRPVQAWSVDPSQVLHVGDATATSDQTFTGPSGHANSFGIASATDGEWLVVGARDEKDGGVATGAAHVYRKSGSDWTLEDTLEPTGLSANDRFGADVAISGTTIVVGAWHGDSDSVNDTGTVHIFDWSGSAWSETVVLESPDPVYNDRFGQRLDISGINLFIGEEADDETYTDAGVIQRYKLVSGTWTWQEEIVSPDPSTEQYFGSMLSVDGDYLAVAAYNSDVAETNAGAVYIYHNSGGTWSEQATIEADDAAEDDLLGYTDVDINGSTAVVGAGRTGTAYVFDRSGTTWTQTTTFARPESIVFGSGFGSLGYFGRSVDIEGDLAVVTAFDGTNTNARQGRAYLFSRDENGDWNSGDSIVSPNVQTYSKYGHTAVINDEQVFVGQAEYSDGSNDVGKFYTFDIDMDWQVISSGTGKATTQSTTKYNANGQVENVYTSWETSSTFTNVYTSPAGSILSTDYEYDGLGRVTKVTAPDGSEVTTSYDGSTTTTTSPSGGTNDQTVRVSDIDAFGRQISVIERDDTGVDTHREVRFTYDKIGNLTQTDVDPAEAGLLTVTTEMEYDWLGRKTEMDDPHMGVWSYTYDDNSNLLTQTDGRSTVLVFEYDEHNRETKRCETACGTTVLNTFEYDDTTSSNNGLGRRTKMIEMPNDGGYDYDTTYFYDDRGRVTSETKTIDGDEYTTAYAYDSDNAIKTITLDNGDVITPTYDDHRRPYSLTSSDNGTIVTSTDYNVLSLPIQTDFGNGTSTSREYWGIEHLANPNPETSYGQIYRIRTTIDSNDRIDFKYTWDPIGNLTQREEDGTVGESTTVETFTYDWLDRLINAVMDDSVPTDYDHDFAYDGHDRTTEFENTTGMTYNTNEPFQMSNDGTNDYVYDANGNVTDIGTGCRVLSWNSENQLEQTDNSSPCVTQDLTYEYDGDGNRVIRTDSSGDTHYINQWYQVNDAGGTPAPIVTYWHNGVQVATDDGTDTEWLHVDHLGSPAAATDEDGDLIWERREYPFGDDRIDTGTPANERFFTGQIEDEDAGLYYFNARYLETGIGLFISPDSIIPNPRDPRDHNRYSYVKNNPLKYTDPSGHCSYVGEFSYCDYVEDGANYGAGITTDFAEKRHQVHDEILDRYDDHRANGSGVNQSLEQAIGWKNTIDSLVGDAQASTINDWEWEHQQEFGTGKTLTGDDFPAPVIPGPSFIDRIVGSAEIGAGIVVLSVGVGEAYAAIVGVPVTGGGSLLLLIPALETMYAGTTIIADGACRGYGQCVELPYVPGTGY